MRVFGALSLTRRHVGRVYFTQTACQARLLPREFADVDLPCNPGDVGAKPRHLSPTEVSCEISHGALASDYIKLSELTHHL